MKRKVEVTTQMAKMLFVGVLGVASTAAFAASQYIPSANAVSVPVALSLPTSVTTIEESVVRFGSKRMQEGFEVDQSLGDVSINDPFAIQLRGVRVKGKLNGRLDRDANGMMIEATLKDFKIEADQISIHSVVAAEMSGVDARIRIDAECKNSKISWTNQTLPVFSRARILTNPNLGVDLAGLTLPPNLSRPEMTLSCEGPFGIDGMIRDYAWSAIQKRWVEESFAREIESKLEATIAEGLLSGGPGLTLFKQPSFAAVLKPQSYEVAAGATHLRARLEVQLDRPVATAIQNRAAVVLPTGNLDRVTLSMTAAMAEALMQAWFAPGVWSEWIEASTIDGFRKLMSSRFKQFIVFPDLMSYPKSAPFWFAFDMKQKPTLRCGEGRLDLGVPLGTWLMLEDFQNMKYAMGYKPLVYFTMPTTLSVSLPQVRAGRGMSANVGSLSLGFEFDARYLREENPNPNIGVETIVGEVEDFVKDKTSNLTSLGGGLGDAVKLLNQTDMSCETASQMLRVSF